MSIVVCNNNSLSAITSIPAGISGGSLNLLSTQTASSSSTVSFTSGIDSTYKEYIFKFYDIHPGNNDSNNRLSFQGDTGTNTNYNQTITSTHFRAYNTEDGSGQGVGYRTATDLANATSFQPLGEGVGGGVADESTAGFLHIFDPSSSTFIKHFIARTHIYSDNDESIDSFVTGYFNTTTALTRFQFKFTYGNIDSGTIKLYGVS
jgi:hypothetical protein|tara:strand:- start:524 stop:1138 length:615 start_codon:yes stop_codon:yes gene_type:complete